MREETKPCDAHGCPSPAKFALRWLDGPDGDEDTGVLSANYCQEHRDDLWARWEEIVSEEPLEETGA